MNTKLSVLIEKLIHSFQIEESGYIKNSELNILSSTQIHYIDLIKHENSPALSELARKLKVTKPTVTNHIDKLEKLGYVKRVQSEEDKRIQFLQLTEKGENISFLHDSFHEVFTEKLSIKLARKEQEQLIMLLQKALK